MEYINKIICGKCEAVLKNFPDNSIDTIITDPPYGLSFMGKKWDYDVPSVEIWQECLRVLKPGGTALIFAGSRTQHRMAVNVEDAGFILKDCIMWLYGSGFPKASDISKQIDKMAGVKGKLKTKQENIKANLFEGGKIEERIIKGKSGKTAIWQEGGMGDFDLTLPATPEATLWNGWKSHGLKPAYEPILVAMKPNEGSYANNALEYGVAGLNIDGGRIEHNEPLKETNRQKDTGNSWDKNNCGLRDNPNNIASASQKGRFPANIILDEESARLLDEQSGDCKSGAMRKPYKYTNNGYSLGKPAGETKQIHEASQGGASRFFYCAKASKSERNRGCGELENRNPCYESHRANYKNTKGIETPYAGTGRSGNNLKNNHPTVKPLALMKYLCTLTKTPTGGIVLDPFTGSGTTLMACKETGRKYIGIEKDKEYIEIARRCIKTIPETLF